MVRLEEDIMEDIINLRLQWQSQVIGHETYVGHHLIRSIVAQS